MLNFDRLDRLNRSTLWPRYKKLTCPCKIDNLILLFLQTRLPSASASRSVRGGLHLHCSAATATLNYGRSTSPDRWQHFAIMYSAVQASLQEVSWIPPPGSLWPPVRVSLNLLERNVHFRVHSLSDRRPSLDMIADAATHGLHSFPSSILGRIQTKSHLIWQTLYL